MSHSDLNLVSSGVTKYRNIFVQPAAFDQRTSTQQWQAALCDHANRTSHWINSHSVRLGLEFKHAMQT
jgi:hypothetical protein